MKTPDKPPDRSRARGEGNAAEPEMINFRKLAKRVLQVDRKKVLRAERKEKDKRD